MGHENRCMLFAPPGPPLRLDPEREVMAARPTDNVEAYQVYLRALESLHHPDQSESTLGTAVELFRRAAELDSDFALAWARLSLAISRYNWFSAGFGTEWVVEAYYKWMAAGGKFQISPSVQFINEPGAGTFTKDSLWILSIRFFVPF